MIHRRVLVGLLVGFIFAAGARAENVFAVAYAAASIGDKSFGAISEVLEVPVTKSTESVLSEFRNDLAGRFPNSHERYKNERCRLFETRPEAEAYRDDLIATSEIAGIQVVRVGRAGSEPESSPPDGDEPSPDAEGPSKGTPTVYEQWPFSRSEAKRRQAETAKALNLPIERQVQLPNGVSMEFVLIPAGEFVMGTPESEPGRKADEGPQRRVRISMPFYVAKYEMTRAEAFSIGFGEYRTEHVPNPREPFTTHNPADIRFSIVPKLQKYAPEGWLIRLPSEAEWEYVCRAGSETMFPEGDRLYNANFGRGFYDEEDVGSYAPNAWGAHDLLGNAVELCEDTYVSNAYKMLGTDDPLAAADSPWWVVRGGAVRDSSTKCRSGARGYAHMFSITKYDFAEGEAERRNTEVANFVYYAPVGFRVILSKIPD